jgi:O6-methylguanine-DNA--protein-cysteine methyltransferase
MSLAPLVRQVVDLVDGRRDRIEAEPDLSWLTPFQRQVLLEVSRVPRGQVISYAEVARRQTSSCAILSVRAFGMYATVNSSKKQTARSSA